MTVTNDRIFCSWEHTSGTIQGIIDGNEKLIFRLLKNGLVQPIQEIASDILMAQIFHWPKEEIQSSLGARVVTLHDGAAKLYLTIRTKGGMANDEEKALIKKGGYLTYTCEVLQQRLNEKLKYSGYNYIRVSPIEGNGYAFPGSGIRKAARKITVDLTYIESIFTLFKGIFLGIRDSKRTEDKKAIEFYKMRSNNGITQAILGQDDKEITEELEQAKTRGDGIEVIYSLDGEEIVCNITESFGKAVYDKTEGGCSIL